MSLFLGRVLVGFRLLPRPTGRIVLVVAAVKKVERAVLLHRCFTGVRAWQIWASY